MSDWQDKVVAVMLAETTDLRELALIVGYDPSTFWRDADFRNADLSGQDLDDLDLSHARLQEPRPSPGAKPPDATEPDRLKDPAGWAADQIRTAMLFIEQAMDNWPASEDMLSQSVSHAKSAIEGYEDAANPIELVRAWLLHAEALLLLSDVVRGRALGDAIDGAEDSLRVADSALRGADDSHLQHRIRDARGFVLRRRATVETTNNAINTLEKAVDWHLSAHMDSPFEVHPLSQIADLHAAGAQRGIAQLRAPHPPLENWQQYLPPSRSAGSTGPAPHARVLEAATRIDAAAQRLLQAYLTDVAPRLRETEDLRQSLQKARDIARQTGSLLDWGEAQRLLTQLSEIAVAATDEAEGSEDDSPAQTQDALLIATVKLTAGDAQLRLVLGKAENPELAITEALSNYAEAEDLFRIIEDHADLAGEPGSDLALLRRGITHLVGAGLSVVGTSEWADRISDAELALNLSAAGLSGRQDVNATLAAAQDAQGFLLRVSARGKSAEEAKHMLGQARALHRRAARIEGLPRSVAYRYRLHARGAEREEVLQSSDPRSALDQLTTAILKSVRSLESRQEDRSSVDEQAVRMAVIIEAAACTLAEGSSRKSSPLSDEMISRLYAAHESVEEAVDTAQALLLPLDWIVAFDTRQNLENLLRR